MKYILKFFEIYTALQDILTFYTGEYAMKTCGIISEYNPFHNGHEYHIKKTRELSGADGIIAV
jgi:citrate lyase synthetase